MSTALAFSTYSGEEERIIATLVNEASTRRLLLQLLGLFIMLSLGWMYLPRWTAFWLEFVNPPIVRSAKELRSHRDAGRSLLYVVPKLKFHNHIVTITTVNGVEISQYTHRSLLVRLFVCFPFANEE